MWAAFAAMAGLPLADTLPMAPQIVAQSRLGQAYALASAALILAALVRALSWPAALVWSFLGVFALARAQLSHAGGESLGAGMLLDALHRVLVGVWVGSVFIAAWLVLPAAKAPPLHYMQRLSRIATVALAGIVLTGGYAAWHRLDRPQDLVGHPYGVILAVKLAMFGVAAALGAYNRFVGFPAAVRDAGTLAVLVLRIESVFLLAALGAASVLARQAPPA